MMEYSDRLDCARVPDADQRLDAHAMPVAQARKGAHDRPYFFACEEKGADIAA